MNPPTLTIPPEMSTGPLSFGRLRCGGILELDLIYYVALVRLPSLLGAVLLEGSSSPDPYEAYIARALRAVLEDIISLSPVQVVKAPKYASWVTVECSTWYEAA
jgi:hypothetical protein